MPHDKQELRPSPVRSYLLLPYRPLGSATAICAEYNYVRRHACFGHTYASAYLLSHLIAVLTSGPTIMH